MAEAVLGALLVALSAGGVAAAAVQLRRVARAGAPELRALAADVRRLPRDERAAALQRSARPGGVAARLAAEVPWGSDAEVAAANDLLGELDAEVRAGEAWPRTATRALLLGALLVGALGLSLRLRAVALAPALGVGLLGSLACYLLGRRAARHAESLRRALDDVVGLLAQPDNVTAPAAPRRRRSVGARRPRGASAGGS